MGWETDLQQASFRGVLFDCVSINDTSTKSIAVQQAPYSNDAVVEDMGKDPLRISLRIFLSGEDYLTFLNALNTAFSMTGEGELIHPIYGIKNVYTLNSQVVHSSETVNGCDIDVDFLVAKSDKKPFFVPQKIESEISYTQVIRNPANAFQSELEKLKNSDTNKYFDYVIKLKNGLKKAYQILGSVRSSVDNILSPSQWAIELVDDVVRLATFEVNDISAISKWRSMVERVNRVSNLFNDSLEDSQAFKQLWRSVSVAASTAAAKSIIDQAKLESLNNQQASITPIDLAIVRQQVRTSIQLTIKSEREISQTQAYEANIDPSLQVLEYKNLAAQVHESIQALIETRPPINNTFVYLHCTSHLLAHQLYGDMNRAEEIKRLNPTIQNFGLLQSGTELTAYAR